MGPEAFGQVIGILISFVFIYFNYKIAVRFKRNGFISFLHIIPLIGPLIYWIILSKTKVKEEEV